MHGSQIKMKKKTYIYNKVLVRGLLLFQYDDANFTDLFSEYKRKMRTLSVRI